MWKSGELPRRNYRTGQRNLETSFFPSEQNLMGQHWPGRRGNVSLTVHNPITLRCQARFIFLTAEYSHRERKRKCSQDGDVWFFFQDGYKTKVWSVCFCHLGIKKSAMWFCFEIDLYHLNPSGHGNNLKVWRLWSFLIHLLENDHVWKFYSTIIYRVV